MAVPWLALLLVAAPPGNMVLHNDYALDVELAPDLVVLRETMWRHLEEGDRLRATIDARGDADGIVTADEVASYEGRKAWPRPDAQVCGPTFPAVRIGGTTPVRVERFELRVQNATGPLGVPPGPAGDPWPVVTRASVWLRYEARPGATFEIDLVRLRPGEVSMGCAPEAVDGARTSAVNSLGPQELVSPITIRAGPEHSLDRHSLEPSAVLRWWNRTRIETRDVDGQAFLQGNVVSLSLDEPRPPAPHVLEAVDVPASPRNAWLAVSFGAGALVFLIGLRRSLFFVFWPGYARLDREAVEEHPVRQRLLERLGAEPGLTLADFKRETGLSHGVLLHHLRTLVQHGLLFQRREGRRTRYFRSDGPRPSAPYVSPARAGLVRILRERPGLTVDEVASLLGWSPRLVRYHVAWLTRNGLVRTMAVAGRRRFEAA